MPRLPLFAAAALATAIVAPAHAAAPSPLAAEMWKTRPVVLVVPRQDDPLLQRLNTALASTPTREGFREREMVLYTVVAGEGRRNDRRLSSAQTQALLRQLDLAADGPPSFVLVGKDGGVKLRKGTDVDFADVFAEVDRMPMRQQQR